MIELIYAIAALVAALGSLGWPCAVLFFAYQVKKGLCQQPS
jgi:hypothetical protein